MKFIKKLKILIIVSILWVLTGCSEDTFSPASITSKPDEILSGVVQDDLPVNVHHITLRLKPKKSYSLDFSNTGLYTFNSVSVIHPQKDKKYVEITGYMDDEVLLLQNYSSGFYVYSITIENLTSRFLDLTVIVKGSNVPVKNPDPGVSNDED